MEDTTRLLSGHNAYVWTDTPQFAWHLYFSRKNLASDRPHLTTYFFLKTQ